MTPADTLTIWDGAAGLMFYIPDGAFEVDGILYVPPWLCQDAVVLGRRSAGPMLSLKDDSSPGCDTCAGGVF